MWTENSQKYKLDFDGAEELETKLLTCDGLWRKPESSRKTSTSASLTMQKPLTVWTTANLWQVLKEMGLPDHLIYLLRNLYEGQEATKLDMEQLIGSNLGKEYDKAVYCLPAYLTYIQNRSCKRKDWMNPKVELKLPEEISTTSDMQMIPL